MKDKIYVGKLGKTVGLKGHLKLFIDSDFPEQFKKGETFTTNRTETLVVQEYNPSRELIKFENYDDVEIARKLTNRELFASVDQTKQNCNLDEDQYFWFDIIGCEILEDGKSLGVVKDIHRYPLDDYLEISTNKSLMEGTKLPKVFLIPYIKGQFILEVDLKNKIIKTDRCFEILENS